MVYLVSYDLGQPRRNYEAIEKKIHAYSYWAKPLESVWFIKTSDDITMVKKNLYSVMDKDDELMVIEVKRHWSTENLSPKVTEWMSNNIT